MKIQKPILVETTHLAIGQLICLGLTVFVFGLLQKLDYTVVLGGLLGVVIAVLNFFLLGLTMQKVVDRENGQKKAVQGSYTLRMLMMAAAVILGAVLPCFHVIAVIIPLVASSPIILIRRAIMKRKNTSVS